MKKITLYLLQIAGAIMLCSAIVSCQQDELTEDGEEILPPGSHPVSFVASVGSMRSRSEGKNYWENGDQIGIRTINTKGKKYSLLGCYSVNKEGMMEDIVNRYTVLEDGSWSKLDTLPLEWPYANGKVSAWYPFDPQVDVPMGNQAERGFDHLDFLSVTTGLTSYREVVNLEFKHLMAKVSCLVKAGDGITQEEFETMWLRLQGHTSCTFRETELTGGNNIDWIIPDSTYSYTDGTLYEALLVPDQMDQKDLISIGLKVNYNTSTIDKSFTYPSPVIEAGMHYVYNITVQKERIDVVFFSVEWNDENEGQRPPTPYTFRVNLTEDMVNLINVYDARAGRNVINTNIVELSDNITPIFNTDTGVYDKFDVLGNELTMNIKVSSDTRSRDVIVISNEATNTSRVVNNPNGGNFNLYKENNIFLIADETTLGIEETLNVGDYFFSDGSWSSILGWDDVSCIGIVFAVNKSEDLSVFKLTDGGNEVDNFENYNFTNADGIVNPIYQSKRIHGYVLALENMKRMDSIRVTKILESGSEFKAGTLEYDTEVVVSAKTLYYPLYTDYPAGVLPYDVRVVIGSDTTLYKKGTVYSAGYTRSAIRVLVPQDTSIYAKGTTYPGGKLITDLKVTSLKVPKLFERFPWSPMESTYQYYGEMCSLSTELFNGFANMVSAKSNEGKKLETQALVVPPFNELQAFAVAEGYGIIQKAPEGTSGWYLPSIMQLRTALNYTYSFSTNFQDSPLYHAGGSQPSGGYYWSSTIAMHPSGSRPGNRAHSVDATSNKSSIDEIINTQTRYVRAVLTF